MTAQDMIDRYAYAVARRLPPAERADISAELRALLAEEVASSRGAGESGVDAARRVLSGFGPPEAMALKYGAAAPLIEPSDTRGFQKAVGIGLGALCVLGLSVALSEPATEDNARIADQVATETALACLQYLGVLLLVFWALGAWRRRKRTHRWSPDSLPAVPDPDAVNRRWMAIAVLFWSAGLAILAFGPARLIETVMGDAAPPPLIAAFAYDAEFLASRALILWAVLAVSIVIYIWPAISGRRGAGWHRVDAITSILLSLILYAVVLAGDVFAAEPANQYMKLAMAIFAGWGLIEGVTAWWRLRHRRQQPVFD